MLNYYTISLLIFFVINSFSLEAQLAPYLVYPQNSTQYTWINNAAFPRENSRVVFIQNAGTDYVVAASNLANNSGNDYPVLIKRNESNGNIDKYSVVSRNGVDELIVHAIENNPNNNRIYVLLGQNHPYSNLGYLVCFDLNLNMLWSYQFHDRLSIADGQIEYDNSNNNLYIAYCRNRAGGHGILGHNPGSFIEQSGFRVIKFDLTNNTGDYRYFTKYLNNPTPFILNDIEVSDNNFVTIVGRYETATAYHNTIIEMDHNLNYMNSFDFDVGYNSLAFSLQYNGFLDKMFVGYYGELMNSTQSYGAGLFATQSGTSSLFGTPLLIGDKTTSSAIRAMNLFNRGSGSGDIYLASKFHSGDDFNSITNVDYVNQTVNTHELFQQSPDRIHSPISFDFDQANSKFVALSLVFPGNSSSLAPGTYLSLEDLDYACSSGASTAQTEPTTVTLSGVAYNTINNFTPVQFCNPGSICFSRDEHPIISPQLFTALYYDCQENLLGSFKMLNSDGTQSNKVRHKGEVILFKENNTYRVSNQIDEAIHYSVYDMLGRKVQSGFCGPNSQVKLDVEGLETGLHIFVGESVENGEIIREKFIID